ncbi:MAG: three-Cys-motif partner protein TcmP [Prevotellaceae bacterium]|nr:three-Cys-motif partner protein TcmP [Prevotellaceae bacterium]
MSKDNSKFFKHKSDWAVIKDKLLKCYLKPYFQKLLKSNKSICYVDCFAGKGKFEDGKDGSPLIAIKVRDECLNLSKCCNKGNEIRLLFIEKNHIEELRQNISDYSTIYNSPDTKKGSFNNIISESIRKEKGQNVFLYIDPYGIKYLDMNLFKKLALYKFSSIEMLVNFNSFGFFRCACSYMKVDTSKDEAFGDLDELIEYAPISFKDIKNPEKLLNKVAGGDYWKNIVNDYKSHSIDGYQAEKRLSAEYKECLNKYFKYVLDIPIKLKPEQHPKYRMIHVCNHEDGCCLMARNMLNRKEELCVDVQRNGQLCLFDAPTSAEGNIVTREEVRKEVIESLPEINKSISKGKFLANLMTKSGIICDFKIIYGVLEELSGEGKLYIERIPPLTRTGKRSSFWEEKKGQQIILWRKQK